MRKQPNPDPPKGAVKPTPPPAPPLREFKTAFLSELVETSKSERDTEQWRNSMTKSVPKAVLWGYRQIIDQSRKKKSKSRDGIEISIEGSLIGEEEFNMLDVLPSNIPDYHTVLLEILECVPDTQISPNYKLSWKELVKRLISEEPAEIAASIQVSTSRVVQLKKKVYELYIRPQ